MKKPSPAVMSTTLPPLSALLAAVGAAPGCAPIECGSARVDELGAHGPEALASFKRGALLAGLREVATAAGWSAHSATRREQGSGNLSPGAMMVVDPVPATPPRPPDADAGASVVTPPPPMHTAGVPAPVAPPGEVRARR